MRGSDDIIATSFPAADGGEASPLTSSPSELSRPGRIDSVEILRGLAALAVAWFHLTNGYKDQWVAATGSYGWLGVEIFFVISGFVIPFAIYRSFGQFSIRDFPTFMARRLFRLEPPYLVSVLLAVVLWELSARAPGFAGSPPDWSMPQVLSHVAYAVPLTPFDWLQPIYWTLAYEFVFYITAGMLFQTLSDPGPMRWPLCAAVALVLCFVGILPARSLLFIMGIAVFRRVSLREPLILTGLTLAASGGIMAIQDHAVQAVVGAATACLILMTTTRSLTEGLWRPFLGLGAISYSLYLVHVPVGGRVVNLFGRFIPDAPLAELALSLSALAVSLVTAGIFWRCFEVPALKLSRRVGWAGASRSGSRSVGP